MRQTIFAVAITCVLSLASKPVQAYDLKDIAGGYGISVMMASLIAVFALIPVCTKLRDVKKYRCTEDMGSSDCRLSKTLLLEADLSWQSFVGGLVAAIVGGAAAGACGMRKVGSAVAMTALGIGVIVSHASALALDISLWKSWEQVKRFSDYNAILGGATFNGIFHLMPYAGLFTLGFIEIASRIRAKIEGSMVVDSQGA